MKKLLTLLVLAVMTGGGFALALHSLAYGQNHGGNGELQFLNYSSSDMLVNIIEVGEYRWGNDPNFPRTTQYTGTGGFTVPAPDPPNPPTAFEKTGVGALWGGSGADIKIGMTNIKLLYLVLSLFLSITAQPTWMSAVWEICLLSKIKMAITNGTMMEQVS